MLSDEMMKSVNKALEVYRKSVMPYSNMINNALTNTSRYLSSVTFPLQNLKSFYDSPAYRTFKEALKKNSMLSRTIKELHQNYKIVSPLVRDIPKEVLNPLRVHKFQSLVLARNLSGIGLPLDECKSIFRPIKQLDSFVHSTLQRINQETKNLKLTSSLCLSSNLAISQNWDVIDSLQRFTKAQPQADVHTTPYAPPLDLPYFQRDEIEIAGLKQDADENTICKASTAARISKTTRVILSAVNDCNKQTLKKGCLFKPTQRLLEVYCQLPQLIATNQSEFADFCDGLYFILYEGAGKDNLRFLKGKGGVLEEKDCDIIWVIKQFRLYYRHDAEHGKEADITKKYKAIADAFSNICGGVPQTPNDYIRAQISMLEKVNRFLNDLLTKIIEQNQVL